jgi:nitric oxide synthase oxygenase domain/subunit
VVRDCRSCKYPKDIFNEVVEHLKLATGGTNIQSVMTIFRPQRRDEIWGMRFWSSQFVRYAGYVDGDDGNVLGDPANIECTNFLVERNLWVPPSPRTAFDVLPLVLKVPNNEVLFVHELPKEVIHEVNLEHPDYPELEDLGYKWAAVPAISNFTMNLGGIKYPCAPFNGWFLSTEIVRNLLERYNTVEPLAETFGINLRDKLLHQKVSVELETAVLHSFEKNDFTMVDPMTVGKSFLTHCKRERKLGRECPGQWSWIGGLVGMHVWINP